MQILRWNEQLYFKYCLRHTIINNDLRGRTKKVLELQLLQLSYIFLYATWYIHTMCWRNITASHNIYHKKIWRFWFMSWFVDGNLVIIIILLPRFLQFIGAVTWFSCNKNYSTKKKWEAKALKILQRNDIVIKSFMAFL